MKKHIKILAMFFAVLTALTCLTACGGGQSRGGGQGSIQLPPGVDFPRYEDNGVSFRFAAGYAPFGHLSTEQHYREMAEANINYVYGLDRTYLERVKALDLCAQFNMKYLLNDLDLENIIRAGQATSIHMQEMLNTVESLAWHPAFAGIFLVDEPPISALGTTKKFVEAFYAEYPDLLCYINQTGHGAVSTHVGTEGYEACFDFTIAVAPGFFSYDNYAFWKAYMGAPAYIASTYVENLDIVARKAKEYGVPWYNWQQCMEAAGYNVSRACDNYEEQIWQLNTGMAYGINGIQTFTYTSLDYSAEQRIKALLRQNGELSETYHAFKEATDEVVKWNYVYEKFSWEGTMLFKKSGTYLDEFDTVTMARKSHPRIKSVTNTQHTMIGTFVDHEDRDGFFIVNYLDPYYRDTNTVTIELDDATYALIYERGKRRVAKPNNGKLTFNFSPGGAAFVIPFNP